MSAQAGHTVVPKFGSWDAENIGYTVFFEKVRDNKAPPAAAPAPAPLKPSAATVGDSNGAYDFDPYEHYESLSKKVPSRPPSSHGHPTSARAPVAGSAYDFDPYEHYDSLSSRNLPSRPPASSHSHGHGYAPAAAGYDFVDPYDHYENLSARNVHVPSRPPSSHDGHAPQPHHRPHQHPGHGYHYHRRTGSNGSNTASEASSRGSKFSPPKPYQPRYNNSSNSTSDTSFRHGGGGHGHGPPRCTKPSAVPRFGVWDEQNAAAMAAQGFTVQFDKVKRHREEVRTGPAPPPMQPPTKLMLSPPEHDAEAPRVRRHHGKRKAERSFVSRMYRCLFPRVRE